VSVEAILILCGLAITFVPFPLCGLMAFGLIHFNGK
jgi:hypothetical protein